MDFLFVGASDENFDNGHIYKLVEISKDFNKQMYYTVFINKNNRLVEIYYNNLRTFNYNWVYKK